MSGAKTLVSSEESAKSSSFEHLRRDAAPALAIAIGSALGSFRFGALDGKIAEEKHPYYVMEYDKDNLRTLEIWNEHPYRSWFPFSRSTIYSQIWPHNISALNYSYLDYFLPLRYIDGSAPSVLLLGFGGGVIAYQWKKMYDINVDSVEIDSRVIDIAQKFLPQTKDMTVFNCDGADYMAKAAASGKKYSVIMQDVSVMEEMPSQFTESRFFENVRAALTPEGVFAVDYVMTLRGFLRYKKYIKELGKEFNVFRVDTRDRTNVLLLGSSLNGKEIAERIESGISDEHRSQLPVKAYEGMKRVSSQ